MIAMQYSFTLPADYDMTIIERRISENGYRLDGYPGLIFKTYLYACQSDPLTASIENLYAPFYLWQDAASLNRFLLSPGFEAVTRAFGWPEVRIYAVLAAALSADILQAKFANRQVETIEPYRDLSALDEPLTLDDELAHVLTWDPQKWQLVRLRLWQAPPSKMILHGQNYQIGHISLSKE